MVVEYKPEAADTSSKIVFIQVMQESLDGVPSKPSVLDPGFAYQDADTTAHFFHVDYVAGEADPYYNGDDLGKDGGTQGRAVAPKINAKMDDTPSYIDANFPVGKSRVDYDFRTIAFSAAGADKGTFYAYAHWAYTKTKGAAGSTALKGTSHDTTLPESKAAITLWASNHGFAMPK